MDKESPILVRIFKEEAELEVWKKNRDGEYALLEDLSDLPLVGRSRPEEEGRRPPGARGLLYDHARADESELQLLPRLQHRLSRTPIDRAWDRTGSELMVHGDCSSRGCYAMTDEQIQEIYALARESFFGGQKDRSSSRPFRSA